MLRGMLRTFSRDRSRSPRRPHLTILSFDVGVKNLSFCMCEADLGSRDLRIVKWGLISAKGSNIGEVVNSVVDRLRDTDFGVVDHVLVEQQLQH